ncbi:DUF3999 family protein, partial [Klebsiella pneumoniae]|uniref:DUF3999 family protein n=1 Tax=Klebsiella pneumoniae TaxID=573 RepID=UPI00351CE63D
MGNASAKAANLPLSTLIPDYKAERLTALGLAKVDGEVAFTSPAVVAAAEAGTNWKKLGLWANCSSRVGRMTGTLEISRPNISAT